MSNYQLILPNGFTLLGDILPEFQSASVSIATGIGSAWDPVGKYGLAAFVCEMMLRGAGKLSARGFLEAIDRIGIDRTETLTASNLKFQAAMLKENLEEALNLYADLIRFPLMPEKEIEAGRQVLLREIASIEDSPEAKLGQVLDERFYGKAWGHNVDGDREGIENIVWEDILQQYKRLLMPNQCIMAVTGNFDWEKIARQVENLFGDWEEGELPTQPEFVAKRESVHIPSSATQTQIGLAWETLPYSHPDRLKAWAPISVLSGGMNSRLFNEVREKRGLCYDIDARCCSLRSVAGVFCMASCRTENAQQTLDVIFQEMRRLEEGITEEEFQAFKARYRMTLLTSQESCQSWATEMIGDWVNFGRVRSNEEILDKMESLTLAEVNDYAAAHPVGEILLCTLGQKALKLNLL